jgi:replicative DNA helicase
MSEHFNERAEENIIFAIAAGTNHAQRLFSELRDDDFFSIQCRSRFEKLHKAYSAGQLTEFSEQIFSQLNPPSKIMRLWDAVKIVQNHAIRRKVNIALSEVDMLCRDYSHSVPDLQARLRAHMMEAIDERACKAPSKTKEDLQNVLDSMQNNEPAFYTGFSGVDNMAPINPGDFVIMAARPGVGKSAVATSMILANLMRDKPKLGIYFCIEMDTKQNYCRIASQMSNIPLSKFINSRINPPSKGELNAMMQSFSEISENFPERWFVQGSVTIDDIRDMVLIYRPDWVIVDYVQIIKSKGDGHERHANISMALRDLALEANTAIIGIAQLNRDANGSIPRMSQIKNSGQYEQDATHIFLLDRPESEPLNKCEQRNYFNKRGDKVDVYIQGQRTNRAALVCSKNRNGPPFYELLNFHPESTSFTEYE